MHSMNAYPNTQVFLSLVAMLRVQYREQVWHTNPFVRLLQYCLCIVIGTVCPFFSAGRERTPLYADTIYTLYV